MKFRILASLLLLAVLAALYFVFGDEVGMSPSSNPSQSRPSQNQNPLRDFKIP